MPDALEASAALDFVLTLRRRWADVLYPNLRREFEDRSGGAHSGDDATDIAPAVHALPTYPWFAWLERGSQKMLWRAVTDAVAMASPPAVDVTDPATLTLDPSLELPRWYTEWDIHLQPGGVWSGDSAAAIQQLVDRGVLVRNAAGGRSTSYSLAS